MRVTRGSARAGSASRSERRHLSRVVVGGLAVTALLGTPLLPPPAGAASPFGQGCDQAFEEGTEVSEPLTGDSLPLEAMGVPAAQEELAARGVEPGAGVTVVVLDSGAVEVPAVSAGAVLPSQAGGGRPLDHRGTTFAGIVAGASFTEEGAERPTPVGIAPGAQVVSVRVLDDIDPDAEGVGATTEALTAGLRSVLPLVRAADRTVVVAVPVAVPRGRALEAAAEELWDAGAIVVAGVGDRPVVDEARPDSADVPLARPSATEDAADVLGPAGAGHVVGVAATDVADPLRSSAVDVAAPSVGALSWAANGAPCIAPGPSTTIATAEVAGVLALLVSRFPDDSPQQLVDRLVGTAAGRADVASRLTGAGLVQAAEAVTRPLLPQRSGTSGETTVARDTASALAPPPVSDPLAGARDEALWWGLLGGGALLLALVLRPVLARRR